MVLGSPQIDIPRTYLHTVKEAESALRTGIISILTEAVALRVLLARLFHQVEALQAPISLQQVLDLILGVLLGQSANEKLTRAVIDLCRYDAHGYCIDYGNWAPGLDFWVLIELRWPSDP